MLWGFVYKFGRSQLARNPFIATFPALGIFQSRPIMQYLITSLKVRRVPTFSEQVPISKKPFTILRNGGSAFACSGPVSIRFALQSEPPAHFPAAKM